MATAFQQSLVLDPFPYQPRDQVFSDFDAELLLSPQDEHTDFSAETAHSPASPISPVFPATYSLPSENDFMAWDKMDQPLESGMFGKSEDFDDGDLFSMPPWAAPINPAINPMDLAQSSNDDALFGGDSLSDVQSLFQSPELAGATLLKRARPAKSSPKVESPAAVPEKRRQPARTAARSGNSKRKSNNFDAFSEVSSTSPPPAPRRDTKDRDPLAPKKTAHNLIEKRYRNNLNDKIAALRDAVPSLRAGVSRIDSQNSSADEGEDEGTGMRVKKEPDEDLGGLAPAHRLNKATILSKAIEYISHLERRNSALGNENAALRNRVQGFETFLLSQGGRTGMWT